MQASCKIKVNKVFNITVNGSEKTVATLVAAAPITKS